MRPHSDVRCDVAAALVDGPGTVLELAQRTGWSVAAVRTALDNMVRAGDATNEAHPPVRRPGVCRPVPVFSRAQRSEQGLRLRSPMQGLIEAWARLPVLGLEQPMEAAM